MTESYRTKLSALVKARLLFHDEVVIDREGGNQLNDELLERLIEKKSNIDHKMHVLLRNVLIGVFILYLIINGTSITIPIWSINLLDVPGLASLIVFFSSFGVAMTASAFINSQSYEALIDQIILIKSQDATIDPDVIKASYHEEFLVAKILRKEFSPCNPAQIQMLGIGQFIHSALLSTVMLIIIIPLFAAAIFIGYSAIIFLPNDYFGVFIKIFSVISVSYGVLITVITSIPFTCEIKLSK